MSMMLALLKSIATARIKGVRLGWVGLAGVSVVVRKASTIDAPLFFAQIPEGRVAKHKIS